MHFSTVMKSALPVCLTLQRFDGVAEIKLACWNFHNLQAHNDKITFAYMATALESRN